MAIQSREELIGFLADIQGLTESDRDFMVNTAWFLSDGGPLACLYMRPLILKCPLTEIDRFLTRARARMEPYGGDSSGDRVYFHYRPTGLPPPADPCEPQDWFSCWVKKDNPWKPRI
jgi:hypothetical protein